MSATIQTNAQVSAANGIHPVMTPLLARVPGAEKQFERLYKRYAADVYRYAMAVMRNAQDAEDVTQTTFMNAYRAMQAGERPDMPKNWLIAIAHNVCRQRFRQAQRRPQESPLFEDAAEVAVPEQEEGYSADDIHRALGQLAFNQRAALVMRELEGRTYAEIAEMMGLSVSAVETVIFRARRALREQLEGTLTCMEAERFLSKQLDGELDRKERGDLRAHLRACDECSALARKHRASRGALKAMLGGIPLPGSLLGFGSGGTAVVAAKAAAVLAAGAVVGTGGYEAAKHAQHQTPVPAAAAAPTHSLSTNPAGNLRVVPSPRGNAYGLRSGSTPRVTVPNRSPKSQAAALRGAQHGKPTHPVTPSVAHIPAARSGHPVKPQHPVTPAEKPAARAHTNPVHAVPAIVHPKPKPDTPVKAKKPAKPHPASTVTTTTPTSTNRGRGQGLSR
jgi:RNA polymerase sigma-70 factor, ECF subfamily